MDADVAQIINGGIAAASKRDSEGFAVISHSLIQGLGVVMNTSIQQSAGVSDDAAQFAAMSTASRIPVSGAIPTT